MEAERLTDEILDVTLALAQLDFFKIINVGYEDSNFNAVATGLNILGQELKRSVVSKGVLKKKLQQGQDFLKEVVLQRTRELRRYSAPQKLDQ